MEDDTGMATFMNLGGNTKGASTPSSIVING